MKPALIAIVLLATVRTVTMFVPQLVFDVDPSLDAVPLAGVAGAGSLFLDACIFALCSVAWALFIRSGGRVSRTHLLAFVAWLVPAVILFAHAISSPERLPLAVNWSVAIASAGTLAVLARSPRLRLMLLAVLLSAAVPVMVRAMQQVSLDSVGYVGEEHEQRVREWRERRTDFLRDRGWEEDSAPARTFERRLLQSNPRGWFSTTNVFASMMAVVLAIALGLCAATWKRGRPWWGVGAGIALAAIVAIGFSRSLGGIGAAAIGVGVFLVGCWFVRMRQWSAPAALLLVAAVFLVVPLRGMMSPDGFGGERSLLFRSLYLQQAVGVLVDHPLDGVGAGGFREAGLVNRPETLPEEVTSAHSIGVDWLVSAGLPAFGWILLAASMLFFAARMRTTSKTAPPPTQSPEGSQIDGGWATLAGVAAGVTGVWMFVHESIRLSDAGVVNRLFGAAAMAFLILLFARLVLIVRTAVWRERFLWWGVSSGVVAGAAHLQLSLAGTQLSYGVWFFCVLGLAAGSGVAGSADSAAHVQRNRAAWSIPVVGLIVSIGVAVIGVLPHWSSERILLSAAESIGAAHQSDASPESIANVRMNAARRLAEESTRRGRPAPRLRDAAVGQYLAAGEVAEAAALMQPFVDAPETASPRDRANALLVAQLTDDVDAAIRVAAVIVDADPNGLTPRRQLVDLLVQAGQNEEARQQATVLLGIHDAFRFDPAKQLNDAEVARYRVIASG